MATLSSILAWRIPGTEEPGGLLSMGFARGQTQLKQISSSSSGWEGSLRRMDICIFVVESLHSLSETIATVLIGYTPI